MKIDVCFSPALYPVYHNPEAIVVVVDVFRATTTMAAAFSNGVRSIRPVATVEEAEAYKAKGWLVGAERNVKRCGFADFGNSPFDYTAEKVSGKDIVFHDQRYTCDHDRQIRFPGHNGSFHQSAGGGRLLCPP